MEKVCMNVFWSALLRAGWFDGSSNCAVGATSGAPPFAEGVKRS